MLIPTSLHYMDITNRVFPRFHLFPKAVRLGHDHGISAHLLRCYTTSALPKLKDTVLQLTRPNAMLVLAHKVRSEERNHENPMKAGRHQWVRSCSVSKFMLLLRGTAAVL